MLVSVIIINYNTFRVTCECIESVMRHTTRVAYEIILVDNASTETDPLEFQKRFPSITLIRNHENSGFAKGNNLGIAHASGNILLLLNSDTMLTEDSISVAAEELSRNKQLGALGVHLTYQDGQYQNNARKFRSIRNELLDLFRPLLFLLPYRRRASLMLNQYFKGDFDTVVDWVSGAFMMFTQELVAQLPERKLDERFFMYGEDQLWCYQIAQLGYDNMFIGSTSVIHIANASTEPAKQLRLLKLNTSRELEIMRYRKGASLYYYVFKAIFCAKEGLRYLIKSLVFRLFKYRIR
ncbi:glycosyltransferase family 2 protein [Polluticoccus soli]|uniref:glycosyltransferase family 2 protein n=1 Tax=Polluticoccus soli TaxID=3034150 RepID=UPI0023E22F46|nr:glycosyltransferase family 2 protein [Flavipsychrobacter sp. JY13-12]